MIENTSCLKEDLLHDECQLLGISAGLTMFAIDVQTRREQFGGSHVQKRIMETGLSYYVFH